MNKKTGKIAALSATMLAAAGNVFASTTSSSSDIVTTTLDKIANVLSGPILGALFIGLFAVKLLIAYGKHQSHPEDMKKEVITALIFAGVIVGAVGFISWLFGTGTGTVATNFQSGLSGATISQEYLLQAQAMLAAAGV